MHLAPRGKVSIRQRICPVRPPRHYPPSMRSRFIALGGLLVAITGLTGCSPAVVGAIALTGYDLRERTLTVLLEAFAAAACD